MSFVGGCIRQTLSSHARLCRLDVANISGKSYKRWDVRPVFPFLVRVIPTSSVQQAVVAAHFAPFKHVWRPSENLCGLRIERAEATRRKVRGDSQVTVGIGKQDKEDRKKRDRLTAGSILVTHLQYSDLRESSRKHEAVPGSGYSPPHLPQ